MANLSNINNKFIVTDGGNILIGSTVERGIVTIDQLGVNTVGLVINSTSATYPPYLYLRDQGGAGYSELQANNDLYINCTNVGIGTSSTEGKLTISYTAAELPTSGTTSNSAIQVISSLNNQLNLGLNTVSGDYGAYIQASDNNLAVPYPLNLQPNGGNVGIGTTLPTTALTIRKAIPAAASSYGLQASMVEFKSYYPGYDTETVKSAIYSGVSDQATLQTTKGFMSFWTSSEVSPAAQNLTEKMRIEANGNVGIGETVPAGAGKLWIKNDSTSYTRIANFYNTTDNSIPYITVGNQAAEGADSCVVFAFADSTTEADKYGWIGMAGDGVGTGIHWKRGGNVGIGTTEPSYGKLQIDQTSGNNLTLRKGTGQPAIAFGGVTNNEAVCLVEGNGASGGLKFYNGTGTLASPTWSAGMEFFDSGRLYPYGGVYLGAASSSNLLDDYEEGTWTPSVIASNGGTASGAAWSSAIYTKVGRMVNLVAYNSNINITTITSGNYIQLTGLPFTASGYGDFTVAYKAGGWTGGNIIGGYIQAGQPYIYLMRADGQEATRTNSSTISRFMVNVTYQTT